MTRRRLAGVTGGEGGIGAAIAEELGRLGWFVVTGDPLVTVDRSELLSRPERTTTNRIVAAGGTAVAVPKVHVRINSQSSGESGMSPSSDSPVVRGTGPMLLEPDLSVRHRRSERHS